MSKSLQFATMVAERLRESKVERIPGRYFRVTGQLNCTARFVPVEIRVSWLFKDHKRKPPMVICREPWMRIDADWHNGGKAGMCWELSVRWRDWMSIKRKRVQSILDEGCAWLLAAVRLLIDRHYLGHMEGLTEWPKEWEYWSHFRQGITEYRHERRLWRIA